MKVILLLGFLSMIVTGIGIVMESPIVCFSASVIAMLGIPWWFLLWLRDIW